jgi:hypothetical protein
MTQLDKSAIAATLRKIIRIEYINIYLSLPRITESNFSPKHMQISVTKTDKGIRVRGHVFSDYARRISSHFRVSHPR